MARVVTVSSTISQRLAAALARSVSDADRARARLHVLDWAACAVAGAGEPGVAEPRYLAEMEGLGPCRVVRGWRSGPQAAALANGPAGAILEMDDVDKRALLHPGPVVIPAALAAAEATGVGDGLVLLDAVVRGYEAMIRVGRAVGAGHYAKFHTTATCGGFGAAVAAASVLGLDETATAWAIGNAGQQASGLWQVRNEQVFTKALHDGRAAANGVASAFLARQGYAGPLSIFEGPQGFFAAMCLGATPDDVLRDADDSWAIHEVSFKPYAACRHAHAAIDAVLTVRERAAGRTLQGLQIASYRDALVFCDRPTPTTSGEAKFSLQHAGAVAWLFGDATLERFTVDALVEPTIVAVRGLVSVNEDAAISDRYPARFGARAVAQFTDGSSEAFEAPDALGDPERPLDEDGLLAKVRALTRWGGLDVAATDHLIEATLGLGVTAGVQTFAAALPGEGE